MTKLAKIAFVTALLIESAADCFAANTSPIVVEIETPLTSSNPLQGYLRQANSADPSPAVVRAAPCRCIQETCQRLLV